MDKEFLKNICGGSSEMEMIAQRMNNEADAKEIVNLYKEEAGLAMSLVDFEQSISFRNTWADVVNLEILRKEHKCVCERIDEIEKRNKVDQ